MARSRGRLRPGDATGMQMMIHYTGIPGFGPGAKQAQYSDRARVNCDHMGHVEQASAQLPAKRLPTVLHAPANAARSIKHLQYFGV